MLTVIKIFRITLFINILSISVFAQVQTKPKLVVGIVVDQMRQEYLYRFQAKFGDGGFKRLMNDGFMLRNAHYNYAPTITGPGHASVFTGTTPSVHGIIGNEYYDKDSSRMVNCVEDGRYKAVGSVGGNGDVSPARLLASTITDELKLFTQKQAKVIGVSFKDRGAILPAGHLADAAYWFDQATGRFISSTYYMNQYPGWVAQFNSKNLPDIYLAQDWNTLLPINQYTESGPDDSPYERRLAGKPKATFPYKLSELRKRNGNYDLLYVTPFANDYLTEFAKATVIGEKLGKDDVTDFLCLSYSTTDAIGHATGPNSVELQDTYMRLDRSLADLLKTLDKEVGIGNYTIFLTADHAVADVPQYLIDNRIPAGYFSDDHVKALLDEFLAPYFPGKQVITNISNDQIFLNHDAFQKDPKLTGMDMFIASELIGKFLMTQKGVANYYTEAMLRQGDFDERGVRGMYNRGFHAKRSGDILIQLEPGWFDAGSIQGTTHGSPYAYDTHVPIIFFGKGIKKGNSVRYHPITDIAPTISILLNIKFPNGCTGQPVTELFE